MDNTSGATFRGKYARLASSTHVWPDVPAALRIARHWMKRARGLVI
jgi:hypothetical protein